MHRSCHHWSAASPSGSRRNVSHSTLNVPLSGSFHRCSGAYRCGTIIVAAFPISSNNASGSEKNIRSASRYVTSAASGSASST